MNKTEKIISILLGIALAWCFMSGPGKKGEPAREEAAAPAAGTSATEVVSSATNEAAKVEAALPPAMEGKELPKKQRYDSLPSVPEEKVYLENDFLRLELSTWGASVRKATLKKFAVGLGEISDGNPAVSFDYGESPLGEATGIPGLAANAAYEIVEATSNRVVFRAQEVTRTYTLRDDYALELTDRFAGENVPNNPGLGSVRAKYALSIGVMNRKDGPSDFVSVDSWQLDPQGGRVLHHGDDDTPVKPLLGAVAGSGGCSGGCGPSRVAPGTPEVSGQSVNAPQKWIALKDRFFVTALSGSSEPCEEFMAFVRRDTTTDVYRPLSVYANAVFGGDAAERTATFYIGPKEQSRLWDLGMKDVMEFGMWRWVCYPVVWLLKTCHAVIPSYGVAVILLTILVRLVFWPLTRKSTEGMKKMQEIQPLLKEIQAKYRDNPQRLQQETFALYREKKVNPLSSCLPMLIQIPVFIALFNVLRSAVELRYAGFLWIPDLSEPEHLFASWFPFGGLNILPLLMAATMFLQSKLTPSVGDKSQQRMMTVFMPIMMLVMFYNFASALSLYWTLSQVMSIAQMWLIRRASAKKDKAFVPEIIDPPAPTRQQRRHGA